MKVEYLHEGSPDCPLVRIFAFSAEQLAELHRHMRELANSQSETVDVCSLPDVTAIAECRLTLKLATRDLGILACESAGHFECSLTSEGWGDVAGRLEPFLKSIDGFTWLDRTSNITLLLSPLGTW